MKDQGNMDVEQKNKFGCLGQLVASKTGKLNPYYGCPIDGLNLYGLSYHEEMQQHGLAKDCI